MVELRCYLRPQREWTPSLPSAPEDLVNLIADAMVGFGPDRHCDGADEIAAIVWEWVSSQRKKKPR